MLGGIKGYEKMRRTAKVGGRKVNKSAGESSHMRAKKKLTAKSEWFRKSRKSDPVQEQGPDKVAEKNRRAVSAGPGETFGQMGG